MYGLYDKKNINIIILRILWEHTDENHRLQQQEIVQLVKQEYGMEIDRRTVKNNIDMHPERSRCIRYANARSRTAKQCEALAEQDLGRKYLPLVDPQNATSVLSFKNQQFIADF